MMNLEDIYYLSVPVHKNHLNIELNDELEKNLVLSVDGSIMAVKKNAVSSYVEDQDLLMVRMGFSDLPDDIAKYDNEDGLYKYLSCFIDL